MRVMRVCGTFCLGDDMAQYDGSIRINTEIQTRQAKIQLATLENRIVKTADEIASLRSKMDALKDVQIPTQEYKNLQEYISSLTKEYNNLYANLNKMKSKGLKGTEEYQKIKEEFLDIKSSIKQAESELQSLVDTGKAFTLGSDTEEFAKLGQQLKYKENDMDVLLQKQELLKLKSGDVKASYVSLAESVKNAFRLMGKGLKDIPIALIKKSIDGLKSAFLGLGNIAKKSIVSITSGLKKLVSSMLSFGKSTKSSNNILNGGLKNILKYGLGIRSLYALINKLRTAIKEGFSNMANEVNGFSTKVDGLKASTLTLKNSLAAAFRPLVEIAIPYIQMVTDAMSNLLDTVGQFMAAITGQQTYTKAIKQTTAALKEENKAQNRQLSSLDKLNNLSSAKSGGADGGSSVKMFEENVPVSGKFFDIAEQLKSMWSKSNFSGLGKTLGNKIKNALDNIPWAGIKEKGKKIAKSISTLINGFIGTEGLSSSLGKTIGEAINTGVTTAKTFFEETNFYEIGYFIAQSANSVLQTTDWGELAHTISLGIESALDTVIGFLANFDWELFADSIFDFIKGIDWIGLFGKVAVLLLEAIKAVFSFGGQLAVNITSWLSEFFRSIGWDSVAGFFGGLSEKIKEIKDKIKEIFQSVIDWVKEKLGIHSPSTVFKEIGENVVLGFISGLKNLKDKVVEIFEGVKNAIKSPINAVLGFIESMVNGIIEGINTAVRSLNNLSFDVPDWVPGIGGEKFGFSIPELQKVSIPKLATGAVIPANREFMAVLGDQKHGRNLEAPEDLIRQIVREETAKNNQGGEITIKVPLYIDSEQVTEAVVKVDREHFNSTGQSLFSF